MADEAKTSHVEGIWHHDPLQALNTSGAFVQLCQQPYMDDTGMPEASSPPQDSMNRLNEQDPTFMMRSVMPPAKFHHCSLDDASTAEVSHTRSAFGWFGGPPAQTMAQTSVPFVPHLRPMSVGSGIKELHSQVNAKTDAASSVCVPPHAHRRHMSADNRSDPLIKGKTRPRRAFTPEEDEALKRGFDKYGSQWALIARDPAFRNQRSSTDVRDRFRNAFPEEYACAGYKPRVKQSKRVNRAKDGIPASSSSSQRAARHSRSDLTQQRRKSARSDEPGHLHTTIPSPLGTDITCSSLDGPSSATSNNSSLTDKDPLLIRAESLQQSSQLSQPSPLQLDAVVSTSPSSMSASPSFSMSPPSFLPHVGPTSPLQEALVGLPTTQAISPIPAMIPITLPPPLPTATGVSHVTAATPSISQASITGPGSGLSLSPQVDHGSGHAAGSIATNVSRSVQAPAFNGVAVPSSSTPSISTTPFPTISSSFDHCLMPRTPAIAPFDEKQDPMYSTSMASLVPGMSMSHSPMSFHSSESVVAASSPSSTFIPALSNAGSGTSIGTHLGGSSAGSHYSADVDAALMSIVPAGPPGRSHTLEPFSTQDTPTH